MVIPKITFYGGPNYEGTQETFDLRNYKPNTRIALETLKNDANSVKFTLPVGYVATLSTDNWSSSNIESVKYSGVTYDLIGTGAQCSIDFMSQIESGDGEGGKALTDNIEVFTFTTYDVNLGYVKLYSNPGRKGNLVCLFLSHFPQNQVVSMEGWWMENKVQALDWHDMPENAEIEFYDSRSNVENGLAFTESFGWNTVKQADSLGAINLKISSFKWTGKAPVKQSFGTISKELVGKSKSGCLVDAYIGENYFGQTQKHTLTISETKAEEVSATVSNSLGLGGQFGMSSTTSFGGGIPLIGHVDEELTLEASFNVDYSTGTESSNTATEEKSLERSVEITIPPKCRFNATIVVTKYKFDELKFEVDAKRYYDFQISGSVMSNEKGDNGETLYVRDETLSGTLSGTVGGATVLQTNYEAIEDAPVVEG